VLLPLPLDRCGECAVCVAMARPLVSTCTHRRRTTPLIHDGAFGVQSSEVELRSGRWLNLRRRRGISVGTIHTRYSHVQALSQDKKHSMYSRGVTCPAAPDPASLLRWAPALPRVLQFWASPLCRRELQRCHVSCNSGPHLSVEEGSDTAVCSTASDPASLMGRVPTLPRVPRFSVSHGPQV
jgi:hypothetical protein